MARYPYLAASFSAIETVETIPTSRIDEVFRLDVAMSTGFNAALTGVRAANTTCRKVQWKWDDILRKAGHLA